MKELADLLARTPADRIPKNNTPPLLTSGAEFFILNFIVAKARKGRSTRQRGTDAFALSPIPGPGRFLLLRPCRRRTGGNDEL